MYCTTCTTSRIPEGTIHTFSLCYKAETFDTGLEQCLLLASEAKRSILGSSPVKTHSTSPLWHTGNPANALLATMSSLSTFPTFLSHTLNWKLSHLLDPQFKKNVLSSFETPGIVDNSHHNSEQPFLIKTCISIDMKDTLYAELQLCYLNRVPFVWGDKNRSAKVELELKQLSQSKVTYTIIYAITQQVFKLLQEYRSKVLMLNQCILFTPPSQIINVTLWTGDIIYMLREAYLCTSLD